MKNIIDYIQTMYLDRMSLSAQRVWIRHFVGLLREKENEIVAKYSQEQVIEAMKEGDMDCDDRFTVEEVSRAVQDTRERISRRGNFTAPFRPLVIRDCKE